ncbi:MAG TPA: IS630 family transposase [Blastocatellia bacterium]|nr:IS630 family transposase [Blastocatellia bacterium]
MNRSALKLSLMPHALADRGGVPPLQRVEMEQLACCAPAGIGLEMTHWSTRSLARVAAQREIVPRIAHSTVSLILRSAPLQPHRFRYWKAPTLDEEFRKRAPRILWLYERVDWLAERDEVILALDEKPNRQVLGRRMPTKLMRPSQMERQEVEYIRHGTVNFLAALVVHRGRMRGWSLAANDSHHLCGVLPELFYEHRKARRIHLIWDGGPSHTSAQTKQFVRDEPRVRVLVTPAHASWLNQAELLLRSFAAHDLERGDWTSKQEMIEHLDASWPEYNRLFAHPVSWSWTRRDMHKWVERQQQ